MQTNSNPSTTQIFSLGVSTPKNPWDVQKLASYTHPPHDCPSQGLGSGSSLAGSGGSSANAGAGAGAKIGRWKQLEGLEVGSEMLEGLVWIYIFVGPSLKNGVFFLVPKKALNCGVFCFETCVGFVFSWRMLMEKNPEILWNCESVGLTILNVSTSVLLGGVFFGYSTELSSFSKVT